MAAVVIGCGSSIVEERSASVDTGQTTVSARSTSEPPDSLHFVMQGVGSEVYGFTEDMASGGSTAYRYSPGEDWTPVAEVPDLAWAETWIDVEGRLSWLGIECDEDNSDSCAGAPVVWVELGEEPWSLNRIQLGAVGVVPFDNSPDIISPFGVVSVEGGIIIETWATGAGQGRLSATRRNRQFVDRDGELHFIEVSAPQTIAKCAAGPTSKMLVRGVGEVSEWSYSTFDLERLAFVPHQTVVVESENAERWGESPTGLPLYSPTISQAYDQMDAASPSFSANPSCSANDPSIVVWPNLLVTPDGEISKLPETALAWGLPTWMTALQRVTFAGGMVALFDDRVDVINARGEVIGSTALNNAVKSDPGLPDGQASRTTRLLVPASESSLQLLEKASDGSWDYTNIDVPQSIVGW